jgi:hypothetical protein
VICWRIARCSHHETVALSLHTRHSLFTCFWRFAAVRYRNHRSSAFCTAEDGRRLKLGNLRSLAQLDVQDIHDREEVELLPGAKSGLRSGVTREECRSRKACSDSVPDLATAGTSQGTMSKHGSFGIVNRSAGWGDSWPTLEGNRFDLRPVAGRADHLSWNDKLSQNPRQPTHLALTSTYSPNLAHVIRAGFGEIRPGPCVLDEQRHATQRHQPATSRAEACGPKRSVLPGSAGIRCGELMPRCYKWRAVRSRMLKHG